jgi:microcystin-dependent protein
MLNRKMKSFQRYLIVLGLTVVCFKTPSYADIVCDQDCLSKLLSQIQTVRNEVKEAIPIGTILPFAGDKALPSGFLLCDGSSVRLEKYPVLFDVIGWTYTSSRGDESEFRLPDLRGRAAIGSGAGSSLTERTLGQLLGTEKHALSVSNMPRHTHSGTTASDNRDHTHGGRTGNDSPDHTHNVPVVGGGDVPGGSNWRIAVGSNPVTSTGASTRHQHDFSTGGASTRHEHTFTTNTGDSISSTPTPVPLMQPSLVIRYIIKAE